MNLIERKREERRSRTLQRVGSVLVCMSVLLAVAFPPQEAKAFAVVDDAAIAAIVSAFLSSCGMTFSASGMDSNGVKEQVGHVIDQYLDDVFDGKSALEWFGDVAIGYNRGKLLLPAVIGNKLADLARWVGNRFVTSGQATHVYYDTVSGVPLKNGGLYYFGYWRGNGYEIESYGTDIRNWPSGVEFANGAKYEINADGSAKIWKSGYDTINIGADYYECDHIWIIRREGSDYWPLLGITDNYNPATGEGKRISGTSNSRLLRALYSGEETATQYLDITIDTISIPETVSDDREVVVTVPGAMGLSYDDALAAILEAIAAGQLSATKEIAEAGTATGEGEVVTPVEESMPVIAELGLPELGETLTTRFPFSIPWDVTRAIRLLAAPPKTPRFEVDFMAPIRYRFGGNLGDTTVVLDFEEYAIVGQVSRWASTIGFCLLLASGTKKLIWTA